MKFITQPHAMSTNINVTCITYECHKYTYGSHILIYVTYKISISQIYVCIRLQLLHLDAKYIIGMKVNNFKQKIFEIHIISILLKILFYLHFQTAFCDERWKLNLIFFNILMDLMEVNLINFEGLVWLESYFWMTFFLFFESK